MAIMLQTDKGKTYQVINAVLGMDGTFSILMNDSRRLLEIAPEFDGLQTITREDTISGEKTEYTGYSELGAIFNVLEGMVQIALHKGG